MNEQDMTAYRAAIDKAVFFIQEDAGYLRLAGPDREGFLQRQTTNDVRRLGEGRAVLTVLTSATARILDVLYLLPGSEAIDILTLPGRSTATTSFLKGRIFFNDKVELENLSQFYFQADVLGPQAGQALHSIGIEPLPDVDQVVEAGAGEVVIRILRMNDSYAMGYRLIAGVEDGQRIMNSLHAAGLIPLTKPAYIALRIEAGQAEAGYEFTDLYTPLETGLRAAVSETKGCYTGQEVIARQITYDKVTQQLCGIRLNEEVDPGDPVFVQEKPAGEITSSVLSPRFGSIALAVLKRPHHQPGTEIIVRRKAGGETSGSVSALPFEPS